MIKNKIKKEYFCKRCGKLLDREESISKDAKHKKMANYCPTCAWEVKKERDAKRMRERRAKN